MILIKDRDATNGKIMPENAATRRSAAGSAISHAQGRLAATAMSARSARWNPAAISGRQARFGCGHSRDCECNYMKVDELMGEPAAPSGAPSYASHSHHNRGPA